MSGGGASAFVDEQGEEEEEGRRINNEGGLTDLHLLRTKKMSGMLGTFRAFGHQAGRTAAYHKRWCLYRESVQK